MPTKTIRVKECTSDLSPTSDLLDLARHSCNLDNNNHDTRKALKGQATSAFGAAFVLGYANPHSLTTIM